MVALRHGSFTVIEKVKVCVIEVYAGKVATRDPVCPPT